METRTAIEGIGLSIGYSASGKRNVIHSGLNFKLLSGELTTMMGVNGSGKSTLIKTLCGLIPSFSGEVRVKGRPLASFSAAELAACVSIVLTERVADGGLTVYDVVAMGRYPYTGFFGKLADSDKAAVEYSLSVIGLSDMKDRHIASLSDGERQKVMIAKSLCQESEIIILDEPTAFLDIKSRIEIMKLLRKLAREENRAFLVSSHDLELSLQYSDQLWILSKDAGLVCGSPEEMVLSGEIGRIVACSGEFFFDERKGTFLPVSYPVHFVTLRGERTFWIENALRRENIGICTSGEDPLPIAAITADDYRHITLNIKGVSTVCDSVKAVVDALKKALYDTD